MYRVVIADDEPLVRAGIRSSVPWEALGMEVAGEAESGTEALELVRACAPCILLLDLCMQGMDGLEVMREIQRQELRVKTIVISNRDEYKYVRAAMKLGAFDYLLKAAFRAAELQELLGALRSEMLLSAVGEGPSAEQRADNAQDFRRLLLNPADSRMLEKLRERFPTQGYTLCCFAVPKREAANIDRVYRLFGHTGEDFSDVPTFRYIDHQILSVVYHTQEADWIENYVKVMVATVESCLKVPCFASISRVEADYENFKKLYEELRVCNECWFYMQRPKIVRWGEAEHVFLTRQKDERVDALFDEMKRAIEYNELEKISRTCEEIFRSFKESRSVLPKIVKNDFINVVNQCTNVLRRLDFTSADIDRLFAYTDITEKIDVFELETWVGGFLDKYKKMVLQASDEVVRNEAIVKSIRYLEEHHAERISLASVAANANLSVNYFSTLFKRVAGVNVIEYLNQTRVEHAKECFTKYPDSRVSEVSYQVGFDSVSYFSKTFKQYVGITAAEYKRKQKQ